MLAPLLCMLLATPDGGVMPSSSLSLPGGPPVSMDYLTYDAAGDRVWVPAGNTGSVDVLDVKSGKLTVISGFDTAKVQGRDGKERTIGPSSVSVEAGMAYVGNRAGSAVCAVDAKTLTKKGCVTLPTPPDGVAYVAATKEVWVTTPKDDTLTIVDARSPEKLRVAGTLKLDGPEGLAVDSARGLFYSNQEDADRTVVFDVKARKAIATWKPGCGKEGPRGLALDTERRHLFVACAEGAVKVLDAAKDGALLGEVQAGEGLDNIDYLPSRHLLYAAAGKAGTLTVAEVLASGAVKKLSTVSTAEGGRTVVVDASGTPYVADSRGGRLLVMPRPP